jgi:hypothetical protein
MLFHDTHSLHSIVKPPSSTRVLMYVMMPAFRLHALEAAAIAAEAPWNRDEAVPRGWTRAGQGTTVAGIMELVGVIEMVMGPPPGKPPRRREKWKPQLVIARAFLRQSAWAPLHRLPFDKRPVSRVSHVALRDRNPFWFGEPKTTVCGLEVTGVHEYRAGTDPGPMCRECMSEVARRFPKPKKQPEAPEEPSDSRIVSSGIREAAKAAKGSDVELEIHIDYEGES